MLIYSLNSQSLLSLTVFIKNPMVQQMMRSDPRFANNPMLRQSLDALAANPDMIRQFSQLMGDPGVRSNVSRMMQQQQSGGRAGSDPFVNGPEAMRRQMEQFQRLSQQFGGVNGTFNPGNSTSGASTAGQSGTRVPSSGGGASGSGGSTAADESEMTEEEMIAEAIARSLRES